MIVSGLGLKPFQLYMYYLCACIYFNVLLFMKYKELIISYATTSAEMFLCVLKNKRPLISVVFRILYRFTESF